MQEELIVVGKIIKSQGNKGEIQVEPFTDDPHRFKKLDNIFLLKDPAPQAYKIERVWFHKRNRVILKLEGCNSIDEAKALVNFDLAIEQKDLVNLPEGSYFYFQIVGLNVYTSDNQYLGQVEHIFPTGSNDVYVVKDGANECLVPAIKDVIRQVDLNNKKLIVDLPEGLK